MMDQKRLEYLRQVEWHADETGWVVPLTQEDKDHFAYLRKVFKRYAIILLLLKQPQRSMTLWSEWQKVSSIRDRVKLKQIQ